MTVAELVEILTRLDPSTEVHVQSGRGSCHIDMLSKRGVFKAIDGLPITHNPPKVVILAGRRLWYEPPPTRITFWGRWPTKRIPWPKRIERIERENTLRALTNLGSR